MRAVLVLWPLVVGTPVPPTPSSRSRSSLVVSVDVGTESVRAGVFDASGTLLGTSAASPHETTYPQPGWAEQSADAWWTGMGAAVRGAIADARCDPASIRCLCLATTSCTVLALDLAGRPLRPALLWMDARSAPEAAEILALGAGDPALSVGGTGPLSAEWMLPKARWLKGNEPHVWAVAATICECQDWLNFMCTGAMVAGGCNVATRWHCDGVEALQPGSEGGFGGQPTSLLRRVGLEDLAAKWPARCVAMGACIGPVTAEACAHLGLAPGVLLVQGGADAFVGLLGLGVVGAPHQTDIGLVTGSSHLQLAVTQLLPGARPRPAAGCWGWYRGAPLPFLAMAEGGQSSTGAALQWARRLFGGSLRELDDEAAALPVGAEGCLALETLQGARTPATDPLARGALLGLSLQHTRAHAWRALLEAVCMGTRAALDALASALGRPPAALCVSGGVTRSPLWLQMHADATGLPVLVGQTNEAPLLGGAVLGIAHAEYGGDVRAAVEAMVRVARRVEPRPAEAAQYDALYLAAYRHAQPTLAPLSHRLSAGWARLASARAPPPRLSPSGRLALVVPSLLSADAGAYAAAARDAEAAAPYAGAWVHADVYDGSPIAAGAYSSIGPATVAAVHAAAPSLHVDVHLGVAHPTRELLTAFAAAGAGSITLQWEALGSAAEAEALARHIRASGCLAGVCVAPATPVAAIAPLLRTGVCDVVDVLCVEPGRGGQPFQPACLDKLRQLRAEFPQLRVLQADGGISQATAPLAAAAGANALVAGSALFGSTKALPAAFAALEDALRQHGS